MRDSEALYSYRRYARECAVMALYTAESSGLSIAGALLQTFDLFESAEVHDEVVTEVSPIADPQVKALFERFARQLAEGVWEEKVDIDESLSAAIPSYDFSRLASVDKNVLRVASWEIWNIPFVPPAVTVNEAVEIAKKYSTAESGKFVNGVLGTMLKRSPKANWDPSKAPADPELPELERIAHPTPREIEVEMVEEGTEEARQAERFGVWKLREGE